jgi:hypothetical protein
MPRPAWVRLRRLTSVSAWWRWPPQGLFFLVHRAALPKAHKSWGVLMLVLFTLSLFLTGSLLREVIYTLFFISALAALGCEGLLASRPAQPRLALLLLGLVLLDLGPTAVQPVARSDKYFLDEAGQLAG